MQIDLRVRVFIPAPAIVVPAAGLQAVVMSSIPGLNKAFGFGRLFGGDGYNGASRQRYGQYKSGTSRGELSGTLDMVNGSLRLPAKNQPGFKWYPSIEYRMQDAVPVAGRPNWYFDLKPHARAVAQRQLQMNESVLELRRVSLQEASLSREVLVGFDTEPVIVQAHVRGKDALLVGNPVVPPLYALVFFLFAVDKGRLRYAVFGRHSGFPAYEVFIAPAGHEARRVHAYDPIRSGRNVLALSTFTSGLHVQQIQLPARLWT